MKHARVIVETVAVWLVVTLGVLGAASAKKPAMVKVRIDTTPPGANIYVDDKADGMQGQTSSGSPVRLPKGTHRLILELDGHQPFEQSVNLVQGQKLLFKLQALPARLEIKPLATNQNSLGGEVFVDGTLSGNVPTKLEVTPGKHTIEVRRPGFLVYTDQIEVKTGETRQLLVSLTAEQKASPTSGSLRITAAATAEVTIDGQARGPSPVLVDSLTPGDHLVEVQPTDAKLKPYRKNVRVAAGQTGLVEAKFEAAPPPEIGVPVAIVPRNTDNTYVVTMGKAQSCQTPCTVHVEPGRQIIIVAGPGSRQFKQELTIPSSPTQVSVQHLTLGKTVAGVLQAAYALPSFISGCILANQAVAEGNTLYAAGYGFLAFTGATTIVSAAATLGTIKLNKASVIGVGPVQTQNQSQAASSVRLLAAGVGPTADKAGAISTVRFAF